MARQTRAQRRARRTEATRDGSQVERPRAAQAPPPRPPRPTPSRDGGGAERHVPGGGVRRFVSESWGELKKVEWPRQAQVVQGVAVVLIACVIVGFYLWVADQAFRHLVHDVFLR